MSSRAELISMYLLDMRAKLSNNKSNNHGHNHKTKQKF